MDRNRDARRSGSMLASSNGLQRRRHRSSGLRDSPDEDLPIELQESVRLRERVKKDRDRDRERDRDRDKERERERERERSSTIRSSKRRRGERMMINGGEDTSEESVNDEEEDDDEDNNNHHHHHNTPIIGGGGVRLLPPNPNSIAAPAVSPVSNHYNNGNNNNNSSTHQYNNSNYSNNNNSNSNHQQLHQQQHLQPPRKSFPPSGGKVLRAAPVWKSDEMIGVSVPRKARSASTKRSHDWMLNNTTGGVGVVGGEQINRQASNSPARPPSTDFPAAPLSPSYSNASAKKKIKPNGSKQPKPPKSSSKASTLNPEELEIEIAEVLYGLKTQSQAPLKKEIVSNDSVEINRSSSDAKSRVSSPISNSPTTNIQSSPAILPNSCSSATSLAAVAPKRKKSRHVTENPGSFSVGSSPVSMKLETDQTHKSDIFSSSLEKIVENGYEKGCSANSDGLPPEHHMPEPTSKDLASKQVVEGLGESPDVISKKELVSSPNKEYPAEATVGCIHEEVGVTVTALASVTKGNSVAAVSQRKEKFQIDLEAAPPGLRSSPEKGEINMVVAASEHKQVLSNRDAEMKPSVVKDKEDEKVLMQGKSEGADGEDKKMKLAVEVSEVLGKVENTGRNVDVHHDLGKPERENGSISKVPHQSQKHQQLAPTKSAKEEPQAERTGQPSSLPLPMSMPSWPGGLPPMGYMAPIQGVVTMDGSNVSPAPVQPMLSLPRPKRCATHCYIARNIHYLQQFMKMNPYWQAGSASLFGSKPSNLGVVPQTDIHASIAGRVSNNAPQDKAPVLATFPGHGGKDKASQPVNVVDAGQRKQQQILLQQTLPHVAPNNMLHGGPAFFFRLNQQQASVAAASAARPGMTKAATTTGSLASSSAPNAAATSASPTAGGGAATAVSFSYPNMPANETQYLAILQNNYPFPIPAAVGPPPNYRGTHPQPMPMFNGSFYPSQIIHPSQLQQSQQQPISLSHQMPQSLQNCSMPSGSLSSQKHMQQSQQQRPTGPAIASGNGGGNLQNVPAVKTRQLQQSQRQHNQQITSSVHQLENEVAPEDSSSTGDSRGNRAPGNIYGQHFAMPMHSKNYALVATPAALASASTTSSGSNQNEKKQPQPKQQATKTANEQLPTFAMSFASMNGANAAPGFDLSSSMAQNHAFLQSLPEATRQNIQMMTATAAQVAQAQQRKNSRNSDDGKSGGTDSHLTDDERKGMAKSQSTAGQSFAFSRSELSDASVSAAMANNVIDSSSRSFNLASSPAWTARASMSNTAGAVSMSNAQLQAQQQPQHMMQLNKQQQQHLQQYQQLAAANAARTKNHLTSNVSGYPEHLSSTTASAAVKFPNPVSGYPQSLVQTSNSGSPAQSPQWKNSARNSASQSPSSFVSSTSALKNLSQQQGRGQQTHTQISFGTNQKSSAGLQGQQPPPSNSQSPSSPMMVGSPTTSSMSRGASGSPRTASTSAQHVKNSSLPGHTISSAQASSLSAQHAKNSSVQGQKSSPVGGRNVPSILGNPHVSSTSSSGAKPQLQQQQQQQQQQLQKTLQQAHLFFSNPYLQSQTPQPAGTNTNPSAAGGYYIQRRRQDQPQQQTQTQPQQHLGASSVSSTGMLTLCPVSLAGGGTTDPAKAIAAATVAASTMKGGYLQSHGILNAAQFASHSSASQHQISPAAFSYVHTVPATVQAKPAEHKQPAGNDNLHPCWQPEKK